MKCYTAKYYCIVKQLPLATTNLLNIFLQIFFLDNSEIIIVGGLKYDCSGWKIFQKLTSREALLEIREYIIKSQKLTVG